MRSYWIKKQKWKGKKCEKFEDLKEEKSVFAYSSRENTKSLCGECERRKKLYT